MNESYQKLIDLLGVDNVLVDEPMSKHVHIKIGGSADLYYEASTRNDLVNAVQNAIKLKIPFRIFGWGSNTLVGDKGIRGFVIRNKYQEYEIVKELGIPQNEAKKEKDDTRQVEWDKALTYDFRDLDYEEDGTPEVLVRVSSGYDLPLLITKMLENGITGLQWFSGIPGTIAGAVYNNIHGGKKLFGPMVFEATLIDGNTGELKTVDQGYFEFGYDRSKMHANKDVLVDVTLKLRKADVKKAKWVRDEWAKRKSVQPQNSLGCVFANPPEEVTQKMGYPTPSVGYFVEHVMGWNDKTREGGVGMGRGYGHSNFIVNEGTGTAREYMTLLKKVQSEYKKVVGYDLVPEIFFVGEFEE